ncbi:glycoside hydrolase family 3 N-terminal domain-containing protein [Pseudoflavonifractor capillosus]|uniref:Glycoside hydrolase family 3 C-terminal domain-containing protein n=1 Tax=Pseudoflavonifractor capillosus TaxID=106588 RepID=A0A921MLT4_9FIRM|nr:glycoside hydrolase family 3 N-terminal domain-containing protein [Pseudoflavonifractor capillosus]HJG86194.1 glycoside hydrolase family 3 C-terminal domain-containing protein [Pseudoflavonifractor capillosus]
MLPRYDSVISGYLNGVGGVTIKQPDTYTENLDLEYNKADYTAEEMAEIERSLDEEIMSEGAVLLKNEDNLMPFSQDTTFSFFGRSSVNLVSNNWYNPMPKNTLKIAFEDRGFGVNETLWNFYSSGNGSDYGLGGGSLGFGDDEDFSINECPLSVLEGERGLLDSAKDTVPVFVWARKVGEGRDLSRSMYNHADNPEDQARNYLEPDSVELELLAYLNENYDNVVLLINSAAGLELGWVDRFENIKSIIYVPPTGDYGLFGLADIFSGAISPSGHTVDTFAADVMTSPAIQNYGDYQYVDENGQMTKYNYITYKEGIYVGYRYYETRYEDVVMGTGNAGDYDYASEVVYPFGYGLSYTTFQWDNFNAAWDGDTCTVTVDVTNTGGVAGKDVVQVYVQSPYTDYDRANNVEKAAVQLVGFGKTDTLQPGETGTVTVTFDREQLKAYDYTTAKTYILDAGDYYITAAANSHDAVNNVLSAKGYTTADGMTAEGDASFTDVYTVAQMDTDTYSVDSATGVAITNQFDFADSGCTYLSRSDWQGTWPTHDGEVSGQVSTWGNEINGSDGASYTYVKTISSEELAKLDSFDSLNPTDASSITDTPVYGADNGLSLIDLRGKDYDDPLWEDLLDQLSPEDYQTIIATSGYGSAALDSVGKPFALDQDAATGLTGGGTGVSYSGTIVLAQTWNQPLAERYGVMIGNQALIGGCVGWYAPAMNIHRTPFSGRNNEYYSEDGFLSGVIASATSRGAASKGMYTFIKHFAVNDQENHRGDRNGQYGLATWANEQAIREIYLLPFEMCVKNDPVTLNYVEEDGSGGYVNASRDYAPVTAVMTSFNRLGYTWTGGCYNLLTNVLRTEWGFHGFVITDNANTGSPTFMNAYQMIEAGGDAALTTTEYAVWKFDQNSAADYHYGRQAMHNVLYTVANSKVMNGLMPGSKFVTPMTMAEKILIGIDIAAAVIILALAYFIFRGFKPTKKKAAKLAAKAETKAEGQKK